jgi:hypothetical protein
LFYRGTDEAAGSCEDAIHYSSIPLAYQNVGNKSRRFSNKVKHLLVEGPRFFLCHSLEFECHRRIIRIDGRGKAKFLASSIFMFQPRYLLRLLTIPKIAEILQKNKLRGP